MSRHAIWAGLLLVLAGATPAWAQDAEATPRAPVLSITAPDDLRGLLQRHLDLARAIADQNAAAAPAQAPAGSASAPLSTIEITEVEWSRLIAAAPAQARSLVQAEGYFAAKAHVERDGAEVRLTLEPGPAARVRSVVLDSQGELGEAVERGDPAASALLRSLQAAWPLGPGAHFRNGDWSAAKNALIARLRAEGYASATWSGTAAEIGEAEAGAAPQVRIFVVADSGPLYRAGPPEQIAVSGLVHHGVDRVRALAGLAEGAPLSETRLLDYQERLLRTGLFDQAAVSLDPDAALAGQARVLVQLKEAALQGATLGVGYSANTGPRATAEYVHRRAFGFAATARNKVEYGRDRQAWDGEISTHPNAAMQRFLLGGTYELLKTDTDQVISQRARIGRSEDLPGLERLAYTEFERANECELVNEHTANCVTLRAVSLNLHHTWRRLDNAVLPTRGYALNLQVGGGQATGTADWKAPEDRPRTGPFGRLYGRATGYLPLGQDWHAEGRLELGGVLTRASILVPDSQRFRAGGDDSVRGYPYRTLAPLTDKGAVTGGRLLFTASAEVAHPVSRNMPSVWWASFIDAGRAADSVQDLKPALGYGVGVRWRSPVGPLKLDWAWGQELKASRIHLSVGIAF
ncbi:MAG: BamA/TamA family outer membrane protein [Vitreoscilla sp.]|nr:BamA/TamA family outer membrane protein [Vitreoscilla sp.]